MKRITLFLSFILAFVACGTPSQTQQDKHEKHHSKSEKKHKGRHERNQNSSEENRSQRSKRQDRNGEIPSKAYEVWKYVRENGQAMPGYVGGRKFGNYEKRLPERENGQKLRYQKWDVNPKKQGKNRGTQRLVTSSTGRGYYTADHYNSFTELKE